MVCIFKNWHVRVFHKDYFTYQEKRRTHMIINTSCEHMLPMNNLTHACNTYFAFQSNDMFNIDTHINCVNNSKEFKCKFFKRKV